eukprot:7870692-Karenia_brevis.AAC.1
MARRTLPKPDARSCFIIEGTLEDGLLPLSTLWEWVEPQLQEDEEEEEGLFSAAISLPEKGKEQ